jgi:hypothetical protein
MWNSKYNQDTKTRRDFESRNFQLYFKSHQKNSVSKTRLYVFHLLESRGVLVVTPTILVRFPKDKKNISKNPAKKLKS